MVMIEEWKVRVVRMRDEEDEDEDERDLRMRRREGDERKEDMVVLLYNGGGKEKGESRSEQSFRGEARCRASYLCNLRHSGRGH